ncbi:NUDIX domain-containing protein [Streptomyces sp. N2-109]|uniref:NUDIX domain-containing protein n=1 Tax=Streptomyces gossypii TaxID=2883101 RepID=A0ABT2JNS5_9ACTN|nr:NUDIX domain-containing protein [Streptomyces gossypii]MCT2589521.1 NUDIX domain-containing protein [Streptomyces gossypii]
MPQHPYLDVMIILERGGRILLAERANTGYSDGWLNLPSGKVEVGECVTEAAVREAREEVGVRIAPDELRAVHVMHFRNPEGQERVGWFFATAQWEGEPFNAEPHKCAGLSWHPADRLPAGTILYNALGVAHYLKGDPASEHGWQGR